MRAERVLAQAQHDHKAAVWWRIQLTGLPASSGSMGTTGPPRIADELSLNPITAELDGKVKMSRVEVRRAVIHSHIGFQGRT